MARTSADLIARAQAVLRANDAGAFTKPGPRQYPHQWNWDSAVIALGLARFDLPRALAEIRALLGAQWRDGMVPHIVYHARPSDYFPHPAFWQITRSPNAPAAATSGLTQPPLLTTIVRTIHSRTQVRSDDLSRHSATEVATTSQSPDLVSLEFVREVYPALLRWQRWLHTARDADGSGLACIIHPWESGTDDSPRWLSAMQAITPADLPPYRRGDAAHVAAAERPRDADYDRFVHLIDVFRRNRYDPAALLAHSPFLVQDVLFNSILFRADEDLRALAALLGEPTDEIDGWLKKMRDSFKARFWDEACGLYFDFDLRASAPIAVNTAATFMPLYAGLAEDAQAHRLIESHWRNPAEYAPNGAVRYSVTTTSQAEPAWEARRYWRGPVWIILNWLLADGLRRYSYDDLAQSLRADSLELMGKSGFREYYDPRDGSGCGSVGFSWSAALALEFLADD